MTEREKDPVCACACVHGCECVRERDSLESILAWRSYSHGPLVGRHPFTNPLPFDASYKQCKLCKKHTIGWQRHFIKGSSLES